MQQASSVHTALGSTVVHTLPTESGISCKKPAGKLLCVDKASMSDTVVMVAYVAPCAMPFEQWTSCRAICMFL